MSSQILSTTKDLSNVQVSKSKSEVRNKEVHKNSKCMRLQEDHFAYYLDPSGVKHNIKRFTWTNYNNITVQIITYGATITSLRLPNRKGIIEDVALGFDDLGGYMCNGDLYIGGTLGRYAGKIRHGTCVINNKQHWLCVNNESHHYNGGFKGLDKVVWAPSVNDSKVILSYVSQDLEEGYPGDLFIRIIYELSAGNEFIINMEAFSTKPTIVNLSNLLYFNLGGHGAGPEELYKHIVSINANCYIPFGEDDLPTGEIRNVIHTNKDFQVPKLLKTVMGNEIDDGYDAHLCVNRGIDQELCFVARALHPPSGRILEMYSNQHGIHFCTANHFGYGVPDIPQSSTSLEIKTQEDDLFQLIDQLHSNVAENVSIDSRIDYLELKNLIYKLSKLRSEISKMDIDNLVTNKVVFSPMQIKYLEGMLKAASENQSSEYKALEDVLKYILDNNDAGYQSELRTTSSKEIEETLENELKRGKSKSILKHSEMYNTECCCKGEKIRGKGDSVYKRHGAICFQSENYPSAVLHKNFPNCELRPGETYKHTIVYKFWIQSGDPNKWIRRHFPKRKS